MKLYHHIGGTENIDGETVANVIANGLQANYGGWSDVAELLPNRPRGVFFWGEDNKGLGLSNRIVVDSSDLDTSKLYAFPAEASEVANLARSGYELVAEAYEFMANASPIPFSEFCGQFVAEWIYTADVPASAIGKG